MSEVLIGRELDVEVACEVMGLEWREWKPYSASEGWYPKDAPARNRRDERDRMVDPEGYKEYLPAYSFDMNDAWEVIEKLAMQVEVKFDVAGGWRAEFWNIEGTHSAREFAHTAAIAICRAALRAVRA